MDPNAKEDTAGLSGTLRIVGVMAVLLLALLGILVVLEVIPRSALSEWATKIALVAMIIALAGGAIGLLSRRK